jgi:hypothetical protein
MNRRLFWTISWIMYLIINNLSASDPIRGYSFDDKVVLTYYYIWFSEETWLNDPIDKFKNATPLIGAYNSGDPCVIDKHLEQMKRAKIDAVAVSWEYETTGLRRNDVLDIIYEKAVDKNLKITIDFERGRFPADTVMRDLSYYLKRYKDHPAILKVEGLPVVMVWTAWGHTPEEWRDIFGRLEKMGLPCFPIMSGSYEDGKGARYLNPFRALEIYTLVDIEDNMLAGYMKTMRKHIDKYNQETGFKIGKPAQHHATISPGYDERANPGRRFDHNGWLGAGWKDRTKFGIHYPDDAEGAYYRGTFEAAMASDPDWLHISTFNELGENSHIEATLQHGYKYIDITAELVDIFKGKK